MIRREGSATATLLAALITLTVEVRGADAPGVVLNGSQKAEPRRIVVSLAERRLALVDGVRVLRVYRTAVGAPGSPSPVGTFEIINRIENPTYYVPGKVIPPGPANPLGTRWLGLNLKGYGIHGTNQPKSIGKAASHGCIRMRNKDVEELFQLVLPGDQVEIHAESSEELTRIFSQTSTADPAPAAYPSEAQGTTRN